MKDFVQKINIQDYNYNLPDSKIANLPLPNRDESKLLIYKNELIEQSTYSNIDFYLPANSFIVFNNTKVINARLLFKKSTGTQIEIFILEPNNIDVATGLLTKNNISVKCYVGNASKWKINTILSKTIEVNNEKIKIIAELLLRENDYFIVQLSWENDFNFLQILEIIGNIPLPPYIKRNVDISDTERYQTIYAKHNGSVAAPTAGLHFTNSIFDKLKIKNCTLEYVTLHVGAGTFKPVNTNVLALHNMHSEAIEISITLLQKLINNKNTLVAVGTTSARTLESIYWLGVKLYNNKNIEISKLKLLQWEAYELIKIDKNLALNSLLSYMQQNKLSTLNVSTQLLIAPSYKFNLVQVLITNFHQPKSTLLLLIAAATNNHWKKIYDYALQNDFRFLSYGDGSIIFL